MHKKLLYLKESEITSLESKIGFEKDCNLFYFPKVMSDLGLIMLRVYLSVTLILFVELPYERSDYYSNG